MQEYMIKLSLSLAVLFTFYYLCLRPLTFYQWNRICLLVYPVLCFFIPFINITPWIKKQGLDATAFSSIPLINMDSPDTANGNLFQLLTVADLLLILFSAGVVVMTFRLLVRYLSLAGVRKQAALLSTYKQINLYNVPANISPFSFGKSIYVNKDMHDEEELQRIIQHEFVHVKQKHTIDLMLAELICIVNWFNPFAWLIRSAIRQNLEFIADEKVVSNGIDKKEYQYLLLKVIGVPAYGLAAHLKFSDLKKRIVMMNKVKSTKVHLTKFLFALPLLAVTLLAFRRDQEKTKESPVKQTVANLKTHIKSDKKDQITSARPAQKSLITDTVPRKKDSKNGATRQIQVTQPDTASRLPVAKNVVNEKGFIISTVTSQEDQIVIVKDKNKKIIESVYVADWDADKSYEQKYGQRKISLINALSKSKYEPLYVVDGVVQISSPMNTIPSENIESISVLRNAPAIEKYGQNGANGVIEIILKNK